MRFLKRRELYLPAVSIIATVVMLLVLIGISTYRNLDRQKQRALAFIHHEGVTLLKSLEAGARSGILMQHWAGNSVGSLIREMARNEDVSYIYMVDKRGIIVHASDPQRQGRHAPWTLRLDDERQVISRIRKLPDGTHIYELAKLFAPFRSLPPDLRPLRRQVLKSWPHLHRGAVVVLGMKMTFFETARRQDLQHAMIMAGILLVLGSGTLFFIFVIQNYYVVNRSLMETRDYTRQVVSSMANGLLSVDPDGRITSCNPLGRKLLGLSTEKVRGRKLADVMDVKAAGVDRALLQCRRVPDREILHVRKDGQQIPMGFSISPIVAEDGLCSGAVLVIRDLREIRQLEERVRRNERLAAVGRLAAGVAHEIRNPLSSIRGFARYLSHSLADRPKEQQYADIIIKEMDRINRVVSDLLTFARPLQLKTQPADIAELVTHTLRLVESDAVAVGARLQSQVNGRMGAFPIDAAQITQALLNLLLNSLQCLTAGGRVEVGADLTPDGRALLLWVEDDGPGIPKVDREKVFDPFYTTREGGTGLGLAIVHKIVENHHGEIMIDSPPGSQPSGCRITLVLPARPIDNPGPVLPEEKLLSV